MVSFSMEKYLLKVEVQIRRCMWSLQICHVRVSATRDELLVFSSAFELCPKSCRNVPLRLAPLWGLLRQFFWLCIMWLVLHVNQSCTALHVCFFDFGWCKDRVWVWVSSRAPLAAGITFEMKKSNNLNLEVFQISGTRCFQCRHQMLCAMHIFGHIQF